MVNIYNKSNQNQYMTILKSCVECVPIRGGVIGFISPGFDINMTITWSAIGSICKSSFMVSLNGNMSSADVPQLCAGWQTDDDE